MRPKLHISVTVGCSVVVVTKRVCDDRKQKHTDFRYRLKLQTVIRNLTT
jgi:hypothetical protein